ncbi:Gfo/Idh/MocA family protein [Leptothoe kymatousa]|uniref:Gfo/Idh/MocA family oxidoreductase n=1 Tax=Leptothoe kymatousa TAU-MAC 1615 TaxID=2364775 RepID=A0ABS5Y563_9CYAN|nr:Gfo/Idh/MocA family oxidoreductase [Leptothoe kymatousa]MBT9312494.1 Gfo/Idh/MocA family oxidoreductase [Leptothoe kymatousa TAU-MAC 1615]
MSQGSIGVAVVGTGFGQKIHIPGLQAHHRTDVVAVYHRDLSKAQAIAASHGIPHACDTIEAIVALPQVQAVSVATPPFAHYAMAKVILQAGKHLLLEKPTTLNVQEAETLQQLAQQNSVAAVMDFEFRFIPAWQRLAELMQADYVGQKRLIKIDWIAGSRANPQRAWNWYARKDQGGGALGSIGSHMFDYVSWLFGPVKRLSANLSTTITQRPDPISGEYKPVDSDDTCSISLELVDGTPVQVTLSAVALAGRGHWVEVYGEQGTLVLGNANQKDYIHGFTLCGSQAGAPLEPLEIPERLAFPTLYDDGRLAPFIRVVDHWVACIEQQQSLAPSLAEGVYSQLLMDLTHQANVQQNWVPVP